MFHSANKKIGSAENVDLTAFLFFEFHAIHPYMSRKTYTLKTAVKLRTGASTSGVLSAGQTVKTDRAIIKGGYRWVRQPRSNGYGYMATGPVGNTLEYVK